jgi:hypothetical protein
MKRFATVTRRSFLRMWFFLGAFAVIRGEDVFVQTEGSHNHHLLASKLANFFHNKESARIVGLEYLRVVPMEADVRQLTKLICSHWQDRYDETAYADIAQIKQILLRQQRDDFEKDRIVKVHGWILSETEARLCALAALV